MSLFTKNNSNNSQDERILTFICPICKKEKDLKISESIINLSKNLTTVSIQKDEICEHHFQAFIDKDFRIRGYQKVDFEIESKRKLPKGDYSLKVIIVGDYKVGKTSIIKRFKEQIFTEGYLPTLHLKISKVKMNYGETNVNFLCWDVGGQSSQMIPFRNRFYEGAQSGIIVVDRTREKTLMNVEKWYQDSTKSISNKIPFILVGNKSDLVNEIVVDEQDLKDMAEKLDINIFLTSAKTGKNINNLFTNLIYMYFESRNF